MKQYVERMIQEQIALENKIKKAKETLKANPYGMDNVQKDLLKEQVEYMQDYLTCLNKRLAYEQRKIGI